MCTGRVDLSFVLRAFQKGADGVIVGGCWLGECHYVTEGNYYALNMMHLCKKLLEYAGLESDRLRIEWISAAEGTRFAEIMNDFTGKLRELGPVGCSDQVAAVRQLERAVRRSGVRQYQRHDDAPCGSSVAGVYAGLQRQPSGWFRWLGVLLG